MRKPRRLQFILLSSILLITACSPSEGQKQIERGLIGETSDPSEYSRIMQEVGEHPALAHFPAIIPENAELVRFHFHPAVFQGGSALQLRVRLSNSEIEVLHSEFIDQSEFIYSAENVNDGRQDGEVSTTKFLTSDDASTDWPETFEILVLDSRNLSGEDAPWNHGVSYGVAVSLVDSEIVYWYEDW